MLDIPGTWVAKDSEEASKVIDSNIKYREVKDLVFCVCVRACVHACACVH